MVQPIALRLQLAAETPERHGTGRRFAFGHASGLQAALHGGQARARFSQGAAREGVVHAAPAPAVQAFGNAGNARAGFVHRGGVKAQLPQHIVQKHERARVRLQHRVELR